MFNLEPMEPIDPKLLKELSRDTDGNFNPFTIDAWSMSKKLSKGIFLMINFDKDQDFDECYIINTKTGERQRLVYTDEEIPIMIEGEGYKLHRAHNQLSCSKCHFGSGIKFGKENICPNKKNSTKLLCTSINQDGYFTKL